MVEEDFHIQPVWSIKTLYDITEFQNQTELIGQYLKRRTQNPPSPTEIAISQLVKGCILAIYSAVLLANENQKLHGKNQRQKRKRRQKRSYFTKRNVSSGVEIQFLIENNENNRTEVTEAVPNGVQKRTPSKCSLCSSLEHTARTCAKR